MTPVLRVVDLVKHFKVGGQTGRALTVHAVDGVSFEIGEREIFGLVGESGSGKTTVAQCVARLYEPTSGSIELDGVDITHMSQRALRPLRRTMHTVFQNPYSSLNPRMTCEQIIKEPLDSHRVARGTESRRMVVETADRVGLRAALLERYPHELSGGQRQRVGLARSLVLKPRLLIADEPVSALDVSIQASILNLLKDLQDDMGFSCLFISHDLATVEFLCERVAVMYLGQIVESANRQTLFSHAEHPYTRALLDAVLVPDPEARRTRDRSHLHGEIPSPTDPPIGCRFRTRCPLSEESAPRSLEEEPQLRELTPGHAVACHLAGAHGGQRHTASAGAAGGAGNTG